VWVFYYARLNCSSSHLLLWMSYVKFHVFSIWFSIFFQRFSFNWRSIDFNFLWESGIERIRIEMKKCIKYGWHIIIFTKDALCSLNFKNQVNYTISVHQYFSNSILVKKFIFVIFQFLVKRGERRVAIFWW
jgi:hypothetical protein